MDIIQQVVRTEFRYAVHFTRDVFSPLNTLLRDVIADPAGKRKIAFVVDHGVCSGSRPVIHEIGSYCEAHADAIDLVAKPLTVPGGEAVKNTGDYVHSIHKLISERAICRHSFLVVIGGGAVLDMAGYAAATAHRGVRLIRLPTTVLSQNDSGMGVKNSVNLFGKKNFLGTFTPPYAVINDFTFLNSLSDQDWRSGIAEAVKVSLIKDAVFFHNIERDTEALTQRDSAAMERLIYRCAQLHLQHIAGSDPFEMGSSRPLDFGHWAAHKLEQLSQHRLRHGEAVAVGIALDATYSRRIGLISHSSWLRILQILLRLGFVLYVPELESTFLADGLTEFQEHLGGELTIMLLQEIGRGVEVHEMSRNEIRHSVRELRQFDSAFVDARRALAV